MGAAGPEREQLTRLMQIAVDEEVELVGSEAAHGWKLAPEEASGRHELDRWRGRSDGDALRVYGL